MGIGHIRRSVQVGVLLAALYTGVALARGWTLASVETYCPFGGVATGWSVVTGGRFTCATGEHNVTILLALLVLTLLARKSFCAWVCPVGTVSEWVGAAARRLRPARRSPGLVTPPRTPDRALRWLRLPVLAVILAVTIRTAELIFRPFCPYYVMTSFHGHEVQAWSYGILGVLLVGMAVVPMLWCRYLCPLGGILWPFSRVGALRLRRHDGPCTACGRCDQVCPHSLEVSTVDAVRSGECTLCLKCAEACPAPGTLTLELPRWRRALPKAVVPILLLVLATAGVVAGDLVSLPSHTRVVVEAPAGATVRTTRLIVRQVKCVDTAAAAADLLAVAPGVLSITAYAARHAMDIEYDATRTDPARLAAVLDGPSWDPATEQFLYRRFEVLEIDGVKQ
ncbi:MAG: 4Fe-4S binding protein [Pseudomonadota bacterium]